MNLRFSEKQTPRVEFSIMADSQLYSGQSGFQRIEVFESKDFGRFMVLDGYMMLTEKDEFIYHEMIAHVPMAVCPGIKNVLVIGGGDGGVVRELTRYPAVEHIDFVEIDKMVVEVCRKYLPAVACRRLCRGRPPGTCGRHGDEGDGEGDRGRKKERSAAADFHKGRRHALWAAEGLLVALCRHRERLRTQRGNP